MSARASAVKLTKATKMFLNSWQQAQNYWRDTKAKDFDKQYMESLPDTIQGATKVIEEIDRIISKARSDCEE